MDRFEEMRTFAEVASHGVNGTARRMRVAPSAVSRRVKELEARLGVQLLTRTGRSMVLTEAGERFLAGARTVLEETLDLEARTTDEQGELSGRLRIAAPLSFGLTHVVPALNAFLVAYPSVDPDLDLNDRRVDLAREGFDLAIRAGRLADSALIGRRIASFPLVVAASRAFLRETGAPKEPEELSGLPGLCYAVGADPERFACTRPDGGRVEVRVAARVLSNNGDALREAAAAGLGVLCTPRFIVEEALTQGRLEALFPDHDWGSVEVHALRPPNDYQPARVRAVIDHLARALSGEKKALA